MSFSNLRKSWLDRGSRSLLRWNFLRFEKDKYQFLATFRWKVTIVHKNKIESNKKLIFKKKFCFPKFPLFNPLASFDLNLLEKGWTKKFKNGLKSFHISHPSICTVNLFWVRRLIQMSSPDSSALKSFLFLSYSFTLSV